MFVRQIGHRRKDGEQFSHVKCPHGINVILTGLSKQTLHMYSSLISFCKSDTDNEGVGDFGGGGGDDDCCCCLSGILSHNICAVTEDNDMVLLSNADITSVGM